MKGDHEVWGDDDAPPEPRRRHGSEQRQRSAVVSVRLTAQELATAHAYAQVRGVSVSGAMRTTMLEAASGAATRPTGTDGHSRRAAG